MKKTFAIGALLVLGSAAGAVANAPGVSRPVVRAAEQALDQRLSRIWPDVPGALVGHTRGVYLDDYGVVFTAEVTPINGPSGMMAAIVLPQQKAQMKQKKIERIPELEKAMKDALVDTAASLDPVPLDQQVVLQVILLRYDWEDGSGNPAELIAQAPRRKLLDVKRANGAGIDAAIRFTER